MGSYAVLVVTVMMLLGSAVEVTSSSPPPSTSSLTAECGPAIEKVTSCLSYATGKAAEPTKQCCDAVTGIREQQPVCLCFFIGQAHNGSQQIKSMGIQEPKLLQLPSTCHLAKVNMTKCPDLLGISPTSPAAAVFMNSNLTSPSSTSSPSSSSSSSSTEGGAGDKSSGLKHENGGLVIVGLIISLVILQLCGLPLGINPSV